mmetsp:Transcript_112446/g.250902  ORF Transcript_112446/g.250902 Transcript_112446/m.250902 type:complete len:218 (-) Transcript_112446:103-756(-)
MDDIVVDVNAQELLAQATRLPPRAQVAVGDPRGAEGNHSIGLPTPILDLRHSGGQGCKSSAQAVACKHKLVRHRDVPHAFRALDVTFHPLPHVRQHPLHGCQEAVVCVGDICILAQVQEALGNVHIDAPILRRAQLGASEGHDGQLCRMRLVDTGVRVLLVVAQIIFVPIVYPRAQICIMRPHAVIHLSGHLPVRQPCVLRHILFLKTPMSCEAHWG